MMTFSLKLNFLSTVTVAAKFVGNLKDSYKPVTTQVELCLFYNGKTSHCMKH
jgi:hypothetical protein